MSVPGETYGISYRPAFGYKNGRQAEGTDQRNIYVKPFCNKMTKMAQFIHKLLLQNSNLLRLNNLNLCEKFNSCAILLYHKMQGIKEASSMGWHTDLKYSKDGIFSVNLNSQKENTPTVIFTLGDKRKLNWRKIVFDEKNKSQPSAKIFEMLLEEGHILILNPHDECPHIDVTSGEKIKFEHGNVNIGKNACSIAFVFRVVSTIHAFDKHNKLINKESEVTNSQLHDELIMDNLYKDFNAEKYHKDIKHKFKNYL